MSSPEALPDLCVIGGSEAGLAACLGAVALGLSCILVDDGDPSGLTNPDLLLAALAHAAADPARHATAWQAVAAALARAAPERRHARYGAMNVRLVRGTARFVDAGTLRAGDAVVRARRFIIATGGRQPGWDLADAWPAGVRLRVADLARHDRMPRDILVVGAGPDAVSVAQSLARLGDRVTLAADALLPGFDPELTTPLAVQLRRDGVTVVPGHLRAVRPREGGVAVDLSDGTVVAASLVLLAEDSRPALQALDTARAGLQLNGDALALDAGLRTNRRHISAIGRAAGARSTAEGVAQAGHALRAAFLPFPGRFRPGSVPVVTATQPQIAVVGHARATGHDRTWRWPLAQTGGAALLGTTEGHIQVRTDRGGRILAAGLVGPDIRDLVPIWTLAIARGLTLAELASVVAPTPSWSEATRAIAVQDLGRRLASPWVRRALRAARWLG